MKTVGDRLNVKRNSLKENTFNVNVARQAEYLVEKFQKLGCSDADRCYFFFRKCFNNLSEDMIWSIYESASHNPKIKSPIKYFIAACRNQMDN
jgi:hypothetical protein